MNTFVHVVEVKDNTTGENEVVAYLTECSPKRRETLESMFNDQLKDDENFSLHIYIYNADDDNVQIVMEALNFVRE